MLTATIKHSAVQCSAVQYLVLGHDARAVDFSLVGDADLDVYLAQNASEAAHLLPLVVVLACIDGCIGCGERDLAYHEIVLLIA